MFEVVTRPCTDGWIFDLQGPLGQEGSAALIRALAEKPALPRRLVLNFAGTHQLSTVGVAGVLHIVRQVVGAGGTVTALGLDDHFRKIFHVMGLTHYIRVCADELTALE